MSPFVYLIPLLPLSGFLFNFAVGVRLMRRRLGLPGPGLGTGPRRAATGTSRRSRRRRPPGHDARPRRRPRAGGHGEPHVEPPAIIGLVACGTVLLSFLISVYAVFAAHHAPEHTLVETLWTWIPGGAAETAAGAACRSPSTGPTRSTRSRP